MTAKLLSWSTFGLLMAGAYPFVSDAALAPAASSELTRYAYPLSSVLPACGKCRVKPDQEYQKAYAIDRNSLCAPATPYRVMVRLSTKVFCDNGSYWVCEDTSNLSCSVYLPRPACPNDSCERVSTTDPGTEGPL